MHILSLNGTWTLLRDGAGDPAAATVPGCVHTDLLANKQLPDPFYRDNEKSMLWIGETDWTYRREFNVAADLLAHERVLLRCHGLDTIATLRLNGAEIGTADNMYRTWEYDIKAHLRAGSNTLEIAFAAPLTYARRMDDEKGAMPGWVEPMRVNSAAWIRKEPANFGWDWGPKLPTSGIWRSIEIVAFDTARLTDVQVLQQHENGQVNLEINIEAEQTGAQALSASITVRKKGSVAAEANNLVFSGGKTQAALVIENPELWWVNGLGAQPLYDVDVTLKSAGGSDMDYQTRRIGLRTLKLERHPDEWGESFYFSCNGVPFFAKGANWIPSSPYPAAPVRADYERMIGAAAEANMNMLRAWGGGYYEHEAFYDVCDEMGIAIWQDFMFACGTYPSFDAEFMANVTVEAQQTVKRIRHHASLALWCGNNEIEQGLPMSPGWLKAMPWEDYSRLFDELLANIVHELDPHASYWPGSPHSPCGDRALWMNQECGDTHLWAVWHGKEPFEWYRGRQDRFCSEFGFQSFPEPLICYEFTAPIDRNITSYVMEHHQRSAIGNATIIHYMLEWFRLPSSFEATVWMSQILQGMAMKYAVEHWRRNMPRTMGTLYWQLNDMWPAPSWSSLDWKGNWKALNYMAKRFFAPLLISGLENLADNTVEVHVTSDKGETIQGKIVWIVTDTQGAVVDKGELITSIAPRANTLITMLDLSAHVTSHAARNLLTWLELWVERERVSSNLVLLARPKHFEFAPPEFERTITKIEDGVFDVTLTTQKPALYVRLELPGAHFSDNFFDMPAHRPRLVRIRTEKSLGMADLEKSLIVSSLAEM